MTLLWVLGDERNVPATGVAPTTPLATQAGVTLGVGGALQVTRKMATNLPDVFAEGDCTVNLNTHVPAALYEAFPPQRARAILERLEFHYTPKHGSWLNIAEIELSVLSRQCLDRRVPDVATLQREVQAWQEHRNAAVRTVDWRVTTQDARIKLKRLYPSLQE